MKKSKKKYMNVNNEAKKDFNHSDPRQEICWQKDNEKKWNPPLSSKRVVTGKKKKRRDENTQQVKEKFSLFFSADSQAGKNDNENVYTRKASHERMEQKQQQKRREQSA